jgi:hypothetical protein
MAIDASTPRLPTLWVAAQWGSPKRQVNPAFLLLLVVEERLRQDDIGVVLLNEALHVFPGCLGPSRWVRTVSVLALGGG